MNFYFAPMEGLTGYVYRNVHNKFFNQNNMNKYFSPFIVAKHFENFKTKEINDVLPENNKGYELIPQILTNKAEDFIYTEKKLNLMGYDEINLNLGCPSGTVVSKGKGSGFLAKREELDAFLYEIFANPVTKISVKTRLGKENPEEFHELIQIFNKYPIHELIIHPRTQKDFYKNTPNLDIFKDGLNTSKNPICYNGDLFTMEKYKEFIERFPTVNTIMIGRGLLANPGIVNQITNNTKLDKATLKNFHDTLIDEYRKVLSGDINVLYKMKELWSFMITVFSDNEKYLKKIKKSDRLSEYNEIVASLFKERDLI